MKTAFTLLFSIALAGSSTAALVTSGFVQNKDSNWSHLGGASASQSTTASGGVPARAIDGNYNQGWGGGSVTHTDEADATPGGGWWQVDLGAARPITDITLFNRTGCCPGRLSQYSVLASNDATFAGPHLYDSGNQTANAGSNITFSSIAQTARYVRVQRNATNNDGNEVISLAEVDVIGAALYNYANLAAGSTASQSSTGFGGVASRGVDGNLANAFGSGSTTHTADVGGAVWWETVLAAKTRINEISLYNRGDCCPDRLSNFRVSVFDGATEVFGQDYFTATGNAGAIFSLQEDAGGFFAVGDRVRVELIGGVNNAIDGTNFLSLREVEIYGVVVPEPSAFALFGLGGLGLLLRRRRK